MSANNQILIQKFENKWYVFDNVNAESWDDVNVIDREDGTPFNKYEEAFEYAKKLDEIDPTEYGVVDSYLRKDLARVVIK